MTTRRGFLAGLTGTIICAPAIVRASSLMAIKPVKHSTAYLVFDRLDLSAYVPPPAFTLVMSPSVYDALTRHPLITKEFLAKCRRNQKLPVSHGN